MAKKNIRDLDVTGKTVLVRVDYNVPIQDGKITDDNRIRQSLPTIQQLLEKRSKVVLFSHLGRVEDEADKEGKSLKPVADKLSEHLNRPVKHVPYTRGRELETAVASMQVGDVLMVENTRFEDVDGKKESKNDPELGKYWASLGDVFVNDAFGTAHRAHASNVGIASNMDTVAAGMLLDKEIRFIGGAIENPERPFVAVLGGAKVSDKIGVIENLLEKSDKLLIGGGMSYTFMKAQGLEIGSSLVEEDKIPLAKELLEKGKGKLILPTDYKVTKEFSNDAEIRVAQAGDFNAEEMGLDIGPETLKKYQEILKEAKTVVWNGPVGVFEFSNFAHGTIGILKSLAALENTTTILGGGDSAAAAISLGYEDAISHISTGGGASLEYLEGKDLPGIKVLGEK